MELYFSEPQMKRLLILFTGLFLFGPIDASSYASTETNTVLMETNMTTLMTPLIRDRGEGKDYNWESDHIFVKLSSEESNGVLTLVQDNIKPGFDLGLHLHRKHTEIFYILEGKIDWTVGSKSFTTVAGAVVYIPGGVPHAASSAMGGKMLMFYVPAGFDKMLAEIEAASWLQRINPFSIYQRNKKYDFQKTSADKEFELSGAKPLHLAASEGGKTADVTGNSTVKLNSADTAGLAKMFEQRLTSGAVRESSRPSDQLEILYVLDGEINLDMPDKPHVATTGTTIYFPPGVSADIVSEGGATLLVFQMSELSRN